MTERVSFGPRPDRVTRGWGGLAALAYPALLIGLSLSVGFRRGGDLTDFGASFVGSILFLVAAPLAWVFAFEFIDVTRFTVLVVGSLSGAVLWYQLGRAIADRSNTWAGWSKRYLIFCVAWTMGTFLLVGLIAEFA